MGAVLPPTSCLCEQRAQGWAPPTGSLLTGLPTGGGSPSLEPPALGPTFRHSSCGSEVVCLTKASADLVTAAGKCSGAAFTMIQGDLCSHNLQLFLRTPGAQNPSSILPT